MTQFPTASGTMFDDPSKIALIRQACFERFDFFASQILGYKVADFHADMMAHILHTRDSMVLAPRGGGKSTIGDVAYLLWRMTKDPNLRICIASKTGEQAKGFLGEIKAHIDGNQDFIAVFGDLHGPLWNDKEITIATRTKIKKEPTITAVGAGAGIPGRHFDIIIGDDLVDGENSATDHQREKLKVWFYSTLFPTLEPEGELRIIGTRYHPQDLYGHFAKAEKIRDENGKVVGKQYLDERLGPNVFCIKAIQTGPDGEDRSFWEDKFPLDHLLRMRRAMGLAIFNLQMQNDATISEGGIISINDIEPFVWSHEGDRPPLDHLRIYMGVDPAISERDEADFFSIAVIGVSDEHHIYVLEIIKEKMSVNKQRDLILKKYAQWNPDLIGFETNAYQAALAQVVAEKGLWVPIHEFKTRKDKTQRAQIMSAYFERHEVHLHHSMIDLMETLVGMPNVDHDDTFDALDHAITAAKEHVLNDSIVTRFPTNLRRR